MAEEYESASDKLDAMISGSFEFETESNGDEDTDQGETEVAETEEVSETEESNDEEILEDTEDSEEVEESDTEENAPVDDDEGNTAEEESEDDSSVETVEGEPADADQKEVEPEVNYQTKYEELLASSEANQKFYDIVTGEFKADGKMVKGFTDPHKIVQSQQAYHGLDGKMKTFKEFKPLLRALKERGMTEDMGKFDLSMDLFDGNQEALKKQMIDKSIDPFEMDMEKVAYERGSHSTSPIEMALDDVLDNANRNGVQQKMETVLASEWDNDSVIKLLDRPQDSAVLIEQMGNGIYDAVQERISENNRTDVNGSFRNRSNYDQYMLANQQLEAEYQAYVTREREKGAAAEAERSESVVADEKQKIADTDTQAKYAAGVQEREKVAADARAKATSVSKPKRKAKAKKAIDPLGLSGDKFQSYFDDLLKL